MSRTLPHQISCWCQIFQHELIPTLIINFVEEPRISVPPNSRYKWNSQVPRIFVLLDFFLVIHLFDRANPESLDLSIGSEVACLTCVLVFWVRTLQAFCQFRELIRNKRGKIWPNKTPNFNKSIRIAFKLLLALAVTNILDTKVLIRILMLSNNGPLVNLWCRWNGFW